MKNSTLTTDFLIVGSGAAGLQAALKASQFGSVTLLTKSELKASSSSWAQGGIAAVLQESDSFESHRRDTIEAGRGLCNSEAVDILVKEGAQCVQELVDSGLPFDRTNGALDLGLEGGHSNRRVLHANGAATGRALVNFLVDRVRSEPCIEIIEHAFVFALTQQDDRSAGATAYLHTEDRLLTVQSPTTILATGGYSGLYQRSTNPHTATGDGLWLGYKAGAKLRDLEFVQFHPTAFYGDDGTSFLISEAVRGEGAYLRNASDQRFMADHPQQELAPRDVVARNIFDQIEAGPTNCVYLDMRHLEAPQLRNHFPGLMQRIEQQGFNIADDLIPIAPAAHYCIGGIATDLHGCTYLDGLYACGEIAATGVHGANRLASNSLLECLVFAQRAVTHAAKTDLKNTQTAIEQVDRFTIDPANKTDFISLQSRVSQMLSSKVGLIRNADEMQVAFSELLQLAEHWNGDPNEYYCLRAEGLLQIASLITKSALHRTESRGVHTRSDFPKPAGKQERFTFHEKSNEAVNV